MSPRHVQVSRLVVPALLTCILLYAALLRLDALFKSYGPYDEPRWLASIQRPVAAAASALTPGWPWARDPQPYVGGDPINYLKYAREMRTFYAAHSREPGFPAATRLGLILSNDADVGVSITSITFALLSLAATYLLGRQLGSPAAALAAAAALAIDQLAVAWAIEGWRDEMFAFFAILSTWAWLRLYQQSTGRRAIVAGIVSAGACLTRITSITLIAPAILLLMATRDADGRRLRHVGLATGIMIALVAPFLINCAIATGDPLFAINNHTDFYLKREGVPDPPPISAVRYTLGKFDHPLAAIDTVVTGVFFYPFANKWVGLDRWYPGLGGVLSCLAIGGLLAWLWQRDGRFLLSMFLGALIPFSATWKVQGGAEWRLTLFAYSFYLLAAFWLLEMSIRRSREWRRVFSSGAVWPAAAVLTLVVGAAAWTWLMPYAIVRESLAHGERAMIRPNERDRFLLANGWSDLVVTGNVTARFATTPSAAVRIPLPELRPYRLTLRIDPLYDAVQQKVHVELNGHPVAVLALGWNPERVGQYEALIRATDVRRGLNQLTLRSEVMMPIGRAGTAYPEIPRDREVGLRLWYMIIEPS